MFFVCLGRSGQSQKRLFLVASNAEKTFTEKLQEILDDPNSPSINIALARNF